MNVDRDAGTDTMGIQHTAIPNVASGIMIDFTAQFIVDNLCVNGGYYRNGGQLSINSVILCVHSAD